MITSNDPFVTAVVVTAVLAVTIIVLALVARRVVRTWDKEP